MEHAQVVRGPQARLALAPGYPDVLWKDRAEMPCGCAALVGIRIDRGEPAIIFTDCGEEHLGLMRRARDMYAESLAHAREGVEAVVVACEILSRAFNLEDGL